MSKKKPMNRERALEKLRAIALDDDTEGAHVDADGVLCDLLSHLGCADVVAEYQKIGKWYA